MGMKPPVKGLRVLHNSKSSERVEIQVPPGEVLVVSPHLASQLVAARSSFEVDAAELEAGLAAAAAEAVEDADPATPEPTKKVAAKKAAAKKVAPREG